MSVYRLWAILRKEFRHIWRDKRTLFLVTLSPTIMLFALAYLFALEAQKSRIGVWDSDQTATSRLFISSVTADGKFVLDGAPTSYDSLRSELQSGSIQMGVVIPPGFEADLIAGKPAPVQIVSDGSDIITVNQSVARFQQRVQEFEQHLDLGQKSTASNITVNVQAWYNRELNSTISMVPGLMPIVLILPSLAIALAITREKELGSFETLAATPMHALEYLIGKLVPYMVFGLVSAVFAFLLAIIWFQVPLRGSGIDLLVLTLTFLFATLGESMAISGFLTSQGTAMRIILLIFFVPSFFLSGVLLPVDTHSGPGQLFSFLLPTTYFVQITRGIFLKSMSIMQLMTPALYLIGLGLVPFLISWFSFRKQVD
jgi:ABC-2 type transport system permease protein